ncbi:MAG: hypothetical protein HZA69_05250 [Gammaproteobacteria bacterium]|nr:hypothetical protein [Gammaproteobacteria bacterium]
MPIIAAASRLRSLAMSTASHRGMVNRIHAAAIIALYKYYFYRSRLADAERAALDALNAAARQGGFPTDWAALKPETANWPDIHSPAHFYLFSLKALAFIRLRQRRAPEARALLDKLTELDPMDRVGASVIGSLAAATRGAA